MWTGPSLTDILWVQRGAAGEPAYVGDRRVPERE